MRLTVIAGLMLFLSTLTGFSQVLLFTIDSCRADRFGVYGYQPSNTPNIDRWAQTGTVFRNAHSVSAWTAPGLASILTGLYPPTHGINDRDRMGSPELRALPRIFHDAGYQVPNLNFFTFAPYYKHLGLPPVDRRYFGEKEEDPLLNWLQAFLQDPERGPFFTWFHTTIVHQPYRPTPDRLPDTLEHLERRPGIKAVLNGAIVPSGSTHFEPGDREILDKLYNAELQRVDAFFGEVIERLRQAGLLDETLIILSADHGEELLDHGFVGHASTSLQAKLYNELVHIPLIVSWPGKVPRGQEVSELASQIDILPTILKLEGMPIPSGTQGLNLFELPKDRAVYFESVIAGNQTPRDQGHLWKRGVRQGDYKYIATGQTGELYNLANDPKETTDLSGREPETAERLKAQVDDWLQAATAAGEKLFPQRTQVFTPATAGACPQIFSPENGQALGFDIHTGALLFDWSGDVETPYVIEYDIGEGDHHVEGKYEVEGNHQVLGPFPRELWTNLKAWNPFRIRVSPRTEPACWSAWTEFTF